jgi:hypothetical protein
MKHVMLDLETMGCGHRAAIVAIGAVEFNPHTEELGDTFYRTISLENAMAAGLTVDGSTVLWWMKQGDSARREITNAVKPLQVALNDFSHWMGPNRDALWGNGSNFDNRILREAYEAVNMNCCWHWAVDRDMRTICELGKSLGINTLDVVREGIHHNALDDAIYQAKVVGRIISTVRGLAGK